MKDCLLRLEWRYQLTITVLGSGAALANIVFSIILPFNLRPSFVLYSLVSKSRGIRSSEVMISLPTAEVETCEVNIMKSSEGLLMLPCDSC